MTKHNPYQLHQTIIKFIKKAIKVRKQILRQEKSLKNKMLMHHEIAFLEKHLQANNYNSARKIAGFFLRHSDKIKSILPGQGSKSHLYFYEKFYELRRKALVYYEQNTVAV